MHTASPPEENSLYAPIWARFRMVLETKAVPQALLLIGPLYEPMFAFAYRLISHLWCTATPGVVLPCGVCQACCLVAKGTHPDVHLIQPEAPSQTIKIEQIRDLQQNVYQRPHHAPHQFILISPMEQLNRHASNALLKILEEPHEHAVFILLTSHEKKLAKTIVSRCQSIRFDPPAPHILKTDYLMIGQAYPESASRRLVFEAREEWIELFCAYLEEQVDVCHVAMMWRDYSLSDVLWFMYLLTATMAAYTQLSCEWEAPWMVRLIQGMQRQHLETVHLLMQLDTILEFVKKLNESISLNSALVVETLLLGYVKE